MQKLFGKNLWVGILCTAMLLGTIPVADVYGMEAKDSSFEKMSGEQAENTTQISGELKLEELNLEELSDAELSEYVKAADITECAEWLSEMTEEEFKAVIARDSWLCEETNVVNFGQSEYDEENGYELTCTGEMTVPYYRYVLNACDLTAPGEWESQRVHYFDATSGYYYMKYYSNGALTATSTIKVSGLSTSVGLGEAQQPTVSIATAGTIVGGAVSFTRPSGGSGKMTLNAPADWGETISNGTQNVILKMQFRLNSAVGYGITVQKDCYQAKHFDLKSGGYTVPYTEKADYVGNTSYETSTSDSITSYVDLAFNSTVGKKKSGGEVMTEGQASVFQFNFIPSAYSVVYDGNGATGGATVEQGCNYGNTYNFRQNGFLRSYYVSYDALDGEAEKESDFVASVFRGWNTNRNAENGIYKADQSFSNLTAKNGDKIKLYAIWEKGTITLPGAKKEGYRFIGWNNGMKYGASFTPASDVKLKAEYEPIRYCVEYYDGIHPEKIECQEMIYDTKSVLKTLKELQIERSGYQFLGWQFGEKVFEEGESVCNLTKSDGEVLKFTALWKENENKTGEVGGNEEYEGDKEEDRNINYFINNYGMSESQVAAFIEAIQSGKGANITIDEVQYTIMRYEDGTYAIQLAKLLAGQSKVEIPAVIKVGDQVFSITKIADNAFKNNGTVKEVSIAKGITVIGKYAFYNCKNLKKITVPNSVMKIGKYAFAKCKKLKSVKLSTSCYEMGEGIFANCKALTKISLKGKLTDIPKKAFMNCSALKKVTLGGRIVEIKNQAFGGCKKLNNVTIPSKVQQIGKKAFYGCSGLKKVTIKSKVLTNVGEQAFGKCKKLVKIVVPNDKLETYTKMLKK